MDDLLLTRNNEEKIKRFNQRLKLEFEMTNMGQLSYFLGIEFKKTNKGYFVH